MKLIAVYITNPDKKTARKIAKYLIDNKLVACANVFKINSLYNWDSKFVDENEYALLAKTTDAKFKMIVKEVEKIHPYKIPCIEKISIDANSKYAKWVLDSVK